MKTAKIGCVAVAASLCFLFGCSNKVKEMRGQTEKLQGASADEVVRDLGPPEADYQMPLNKHYVFVYSAQRVHKGSVAGAMLSGMGAGMSGQQPTTKEPRMVGCRFELEFGDDNKHVVAVRERGDGC